MTAAAIVAAVFILRTNAEPPLFMSLALGRFDHLSRGAQVNGQSVNKNPSIRRALQIFGLSVDAKACGFQAVFEPSVKLQQAAANC